MQIIPLEAVLQSLGTKGILAALLTHYGPCELIDHWKQGEFHHDLVFAVPKDAPSPGPYLVVSTNCNGGVKEIIALASRPKRWALWNERCPDNPAFEGSLPAVLAHVRHTHWFNPCELLRSDARSELRADSRRRQRGGGWVSLDSDEE